MVLRFSDHFGLGKSQAELDFVDVPLDTDLPLFVDPYAFGIEEGDWFVACNDLIVGFFGLAVASIKDGDHDRARRLLHHLREPNDTRLGFSSGRPRGNGIGSEQADHLFERLRASEAVRTGKLRDLADAELVIPGISRDKISDVTTNIIRAQLIDYTRAQCALLDLPTRCVPSGMYWHPGRQDWANGYVELPVYERRRILLVPKTAVRHNLAVDHQRYYRHFVPEYLQAEHLHAGSSLVHILKNGNRRVYKGDLEQRYPLSKEFLFEFSEEHPEVLEQYRESLPSIPEPLSDEDIERKQSDPRALRIEEMVERLPRIPVGPDAANEFHDFVVGALVAVFEPDLMYPKKERENNEGRKRIDVVFTNRARDGFFYFLTATHGVRSPYVFVECKNYGGDVGNPETDQLAGRFSDARGKFGILVCRSVRDRARMLERQRDLLHAKQEYALVLDDVDMLELLRLRARDDRAGIDAFLDGRFAELVM